LRPLEGRYSELAERPRKVGVAILVTGLIVALLTLVPAAASAAITHNAEPFSPLDGSGSGLTLEELPNIAIDEETGNIFVLDGGPGHERIAILGAEGGAPVGVAAPYEIPGFSIGANTGSPGLAFDNSPTGSRGTLYAAVTGSGVVRRYTRSATTERYELAGEIAIPKHEADMQLYVDQSGDLYVISGTNLFKFGPSGTPLSEYQLVVGQNEGSQGIAVDTAGDLFLATTGGLYKFPANGSGAIDPTNFSKLATAPAPQTVTGLAYDPALNHVFAVIGDLPSEFDAASGAKLDTFGADAIIRSHGVAVNSSTTRIYISERGAFTKGGAKVVAFGPALTVPTVQIAPASSVTGTEAILNGTVNPEGLPITECIFEWGVDLAGSPNYEHQQGCAPAPPTDSEPHQVAASISGLTTNGTLYHFRLVAKNANGEEVTADETFETAPAVATQPASGVTPQAATLNGVLRPEGLQFTVCEFEYGLATSKAFEASVPCEPAAGTIPPDFGPHSVTAAVTNLQANAKYRFRLVATNSAGTFEGKALTFTAAGPPLISEIRARNADQTSALVEAAVDPRGFATSYVFEWGPTVAYGNTAGAATIPTGQGITRVATTLSGLQNGTTYHYRLVATNGEGRLSTSPDHEVETLNSCGLPDQRCLELTSPSNAGPVALPGAPSYNLELKYQAATQGGAVAYAVESGLPGATRGAEVLYRSDRGTDGWSTSQLSPGISARDESVGASSETSRTLGLSPDLSCGLVESTQLLTSDPGMKAAVEAGGKNLYRLNPDGSYTAISKLTPVNFELDTSEQEGFYFAFGGATPNCDKVVFTSFYRYPGVGGAPDPGNLGAVGAYAYEWDEGVLRNLGTVPGPTGEVVVPALPGGPSENPRQAIRSNVVSEDGSRVFFSAERQESGIPEEVGKRGIFVREDGSVTRDLSLSETAVADEGADFQSATPDGSRVYFTANHGLTAVSSPEGTDLYEYNLETEELTDLSVDEEPGGAAVAGVLGTSENGAHAYFAARGQLLPGRGKTRAENVQDSTYSVYDNAGGVVSFVGTVTLDDLRFDTLGTQEFLAAQVSPDGRYLLFESSAEVTGYDSEGAPEAYLYDAGSTSEPVVCISCRQDGLPPAGKAFGTRILTKPFDSNPRTPTDAPLSLAMKNGVPQVFFTSLDSLAPGAPEGTFSIYEWSHGQVFRVTTEGPGQQAQEPQAQIKFLGASSEGSDLYFRTASPLTWEDGDQRSSVYDARSGGGFLQPGPPAPPCDPTVEGSCTGPRVQAPANPGAATANFAGPENPKASHKKHKKKKHTKQGKKKHTKQGKKKRAKDKKQGKRDTRHANSDRRTGK
jgi:hypothetical protein